MKQFGYIYKTTNLVTGMVYIGQTCRQDQRVNRYLGSGKWLKRAIKKYGKANFCKEIICWCSDNDQLNRMEKLYIKLLSPDYNLNAGGQSAIHFKHTAESREKLRMAHKGKVLSKEHKLRIAQSHLGLKHKTHITTEEHKRKISESLAGRHLSAETKLKLAQVNIGKKVSEETRAKMSAAQKRRYACTSNILP